MREFIERVIRTLDNSITAKQADDAFYRDIVNRINAGEIPEPPNYKSMMLAARENFLELQRTQAFRQYYHDQFLQPYLDAEQ